MEQNNSPRNVSPPHPPPPPHPPGRTATATSSTTSITAHFLEPEWLDLPWQQTQHTVSRSMQLFRVMDTVAVTVAVSVVVNASSPAHEDPPSTTTRTTAASTSRSTAAASFWRSEPHGTGFPVSSPSRFVAARRPPVLPTRSWVSACSSACAWVWA